MDTASYETINEAKASMDHIYNQADPRAYFRELEKLGYAIPDAAKPVFDRLIAHLQGRHDGALQVLDLGCSYGVNAALLKYGLSMKDLYAFWGQSDLAWASPAEIAARDQLRLAAVHDPADIRMIGIDVAENAVAYAEDVGLLDEGLTVNLETETLSGAEQQTLAPVELVLSTGCVGYVTDRSFEALLPAVSRGGAPWLANFVLRMFPFDAIEAALDARGYITEKLEGQTFFQRRFASRAEHDHALAQLHDRGIAPTRGELDGELRADFYLSRPRKDAAELPIGQLLAA